MQKGRGGRVGEADRKWTHEAAKKEIPSVKAKSGPWKETGELSRTTTTATHLLLRMELPAWMCGCLPSGCVFSDHVHRFSQRRWRRWGEARGVRNNAWL